jgi:hypothetical protein
MVSHYRNHFTFDSETARLFCAPPCIVQPLDFIKVYLPFCGPKGILSAYEISPYFAWMFEKHGRF